MPASSQDPTTGLRGGVFRRVLVGFDGSKEARRALRAAVALTADLGGQLHVLLVVRPPAHGETPEGLARAAQAERDNLSQGLLLAWQEAQNQPDGDISTDVVFSDNPGKALARHAQEHGFDLIVVGGHGREHLTHRGIGHSLEALLRNHPCPVLVV